MTSQNLEAKALNRNSNQTLTHEEAVTVDGLEDIFKWAQDVVSDGQHAEDNRAKKVREQRIRRRVLELVQSAKEQKQKDQAKDEITYLQRRVIALLQKLSESIEENSSLKQTVVAQQLTLVKLPELEAEVKRLQDIELDREAFDESRRELTNTLSKLKKDRDYLEELVIVNERENSRLTHLFRETKDELDKLKGRRWWHWLISPWSP